MTQEEFKKTAFRKGDKVRINKKVTLIDDVSFETYSIGCCGRYYELDEILEYIPVEVDVELDTSKVLDHFQVILDHFQVIKDENIQPKKAEHAQFWREVWLATWKDPNVENIGDCTEFTDQALADYKQRFN